ncbi:hypothetical protein O7635_24655 [Asanoa sp. WMMD1127]|uniref:hypothetical protein n=1 Tax=Asanoa sp. WMMD1127 TaxID=3016107 RepID=UPI002415F0A8|nr:hypothetical protein [Asanoa sp. WMMD1127]MDG4825052.1 hypothetical protein [Asanoa sp. WMMD1127]
MNLDDKRWEQLAQQAKWRQLEVARKQAEGWRTALIGLTALLAVITIVKGPADLAALSDTARLAVLVTLALGFIALVAGSLTAVRGSSGRPENIPLKGPALKAWTNDEVKAIGRMIKWTAGLLVAGVALVAIATGVTWVAGGNAPGTAVKVVTTNAEACGEIISIDARQLVLDTDPGPDRNRLVLDTRSLVSATPGSCQPK